MSEKRVQFEFSETEIRALLDAVKHGRPSPSQTVDEVEATLRAALPPELAPQRLARAGAVLMTADKRITVELTEAEARRFLDITAFDGAEVGVVRDRIAAALPPEYPEGTFAVVSGSRFSDHPNFARWSDGAWRFADGLAINYGETEIVVEAIRTLADDEIAVKRVSAFGGADLARTYASDLRGAGHAHIAGAHLVENYADALEAESRP